MNKISEEKENKIIEALKRGDGISKIRKDLNVGYAIVRKNINENPGLYKPSKENKIIEALTRDDGINKIIKDLNVGYAVIRKIINENPGIYKPKGATGYGKIYSFRVPALMADKINNYIKEGGITTTIFFNDLLKEWGCVDK